MRYLLIGIISIMFSGCMETGPFLRTQAHLNKQPLGAEAICYAKRDCVEIAEDFCTNGIQSFAWSTFSEGHWEWDNQFKQWYKAKLSKIRLYFTCKCHLDKTTKVLL